MPAPALGNLTIGDIVFVTFEGRCLEQRILNTFYYKVTDLGPGGPTGRWDALEALKDTFQAPAGLQDLFLAAMSDAYTLESIRLQFVEPSRMIYRKFAVNTLGDLVSPIDTANVAASIERRAAVMTREGIGRLQIGPLTQLAMENGVLSAGYTATLTTLATFMTFDLLAGTLLDQQWTPVLYGIDGEGVSHNFNVVDAFPHSQVRTMSRRTVGRGE